MPYYHKRVARLKPHLHGEKGPEYTQKSHRLLEPPWAACRLFIHFLANRSESSTREIKAGSARSNLVPRVLSRTQGTRLGKKVTYLVGSFFCDGRVILLAGPIFLHINTLARPARPTGSRRENICTLFECQCIQHESTDWRHYILRLQLETGPPFYVVILATRRSSRLQCKESTFISQIF